jgi:hypothetical protein
MCAVALSYEPHTALDRTATACSQSEPRPSFAGRWGALNFFKTNGEYMTKESHTTKN